MLTLCPNCHARAKLPDDHAGAKARCAECGRVFVARANGVAPRARAARLALVLGGLLGTLALLALIASLRNERKTVSAADMPVNAPAPADE